MLYKLINPSDPYIFEAENKEIAAITVFLISTNYGANSEDDSEEIPLFIFGGAREWYVEQFGRTPEEGIEEYRDKIIKSLDSFMYGNFKDRARYELALKSITDPEKRDEFKTEWQDGCTSINNIGGIAHELAKQLLRSEKNDPA